MQFLQVLEAASVLAVIYADCDASTIQPVKTCYVAYLAGFNLTLDGNNRLPEYWTFHNDRAEWIFKDGTPALTPICDLFHTLNNCVKPFTCLDYKDYENSLGPIGVNTSYL